MKLLSRVLVSALALLAAPLSHAQPDSAPLDFGNASWPAHPTLLLAKYRGQRLPVVAVDKNQPVVVVDGKRTTLPASTPLVTQLAPHYVSTHVVFEDGNSNIENARVQNSLSADKATASVVEGTLTFTAKKNLSDCYLLVVSFDSTSFVQPDADDHCKMTLLEIGTLHQGDTRDVPFSAPLVVPRHVYTHDFWQQSANEPAATPVFWQLYSGGLEVRGLPLANIKIENTTYVLTPTPQSITRVTGLGEFFYLHESAEHAAAVAAWRQENANGDHLAEPYTQTPVQPGARVGLPSEGSALLSVNAEGNVTQVALEQAFPDVAAKRLAACLKLWQFLPAIKNGVPVPARIRVPLTF